MLTQKQIKEFANADRFEKLDLLRDMIKSFEKTKEKLREELIAEGLAEYRQSWRDEYVTKGHWVRKFVKI